MTSTQRRDTCTFSGVRSRSNSIRARQKPKPYSTSELPFDYHDSHPCNPSRCQSETPSGHLHTRRDAASKDGRQLNKLRGLVIWGDGHQRRDVPRYAAASCGPDTSSAGPGGRTVDSPAVGWVKGCATTTTRTPCRQGREVPGRYVAVRPAPDQASCRRGRETSPERVGEHTLLKIAVHARRRGQDRHKRVWGPRRTIREQHGDQPNEAIPQPRSTDMLAAERPSMSAALFGP